MIRQPKRMLDDPSEPAEVRDLLQAGAKDTVEDYDYNQGLAKHLAIVAAGTPPPPWAEQLSAGSGAGGSAAATAGVEAAAGGGAAATAGISLKTTALVLGLPVATAGIVAAVVLGTVEPKPKVAKAPAVAVSTQAQPGAQAPLPTAVEVDENEPCGADAPRVGQQIGEQDERSSVLSAPPRTKRTSRAQSRRGEQALERRERRLGMQIADSSHESSEPAVYEPETTVNKTEAGEERQSAPVRNDLHARWARGEEALERVRARSERSTAKLDERPETEPQAPTEPRIDPLRREMHMLSSANNLLSSDPERALAIARSGERNYPNSMFSEERRHIIILALIKLDRMDEARAMAWPYLRKYPRGPFAERIRRALATGQVR